VGGRRSGACPPAARGRAGGGGDVAFAAPGQDSTNSRQPNSNPFGVCYSRCALAQTDHLTRTTANAANHTLYVILIFVALSTPVRNAGTVRQRFDTGNGPATSEDTTDGSHDWQHTDKRKAQ